MKLIAGLFFGLPWTWQIGIVAALVMGAGGTIWGVYSFIDHNGYVRGAGEANASWQLRWDSRELGWQQAQAQEAIRQDRMNEVATSAELVEVSSIEADRDAAIALNAQLSSEAAADPNANDVVFDKAAVDRYNRSIRR